MGTIKECYTIEIYTDDSPQSLPSMIDEMKQLTSTKPKKKNTAVDYDEPVIMSKITTKKKDKKKKRKGRTLSDDATFESLSIDDDTTDDSNNEVDDNALLDIEAVLMEEDEEEDIEGDLTSKGKGGYHELKKHKNNFKKEFAEELTLLYSLLDETSKFGKSLEKDLEALKGSKVRGVSKYTNELAQLILNVKGTKLSIVKEINSTKKTVADLTMKSEAKTKDNDNKNSPEHLASAYFKNILTHGRTNFIDTIAGGTSYAQDDLESVVNEIESNDGSSDDEDEYTRILTERLEANGNPNRSLAGSKYIEYENMGVKINVRKCIDTGEWEFVAIDKYKQRVDDYPVPTKREAGRMKFSSDGEYATDSKGRIYNVIEYFLPEE